MNVGIVIVTFNDAACIDRCIQSLRAQSRPADTILLWDNASHDMTLDIASAYSDVHILRSPRNIGFAAANNRAIQHLLTKDYTYILLVNPDTIAAPTMLARLLDCAETTDAAVVQPAILLPDATTVNSLGNRIHYTGISFCEDYGRAYQPNRPISPIVAASGAAMLIRARVLHEQPPFDDAFFMYAEDTDFSWRLHLRGERILLAPDATIVHDYAFRLSPHKCFLLERNRLSMIVKNYAFKTLLVLLPMLLVMEIQMLLYSLLHRWFYRKLAAYVHVAYAFPSILRKRRIVQHQRRNSDHALMATFSPTITYHGPMAPVVHRLANPLFAGYFRMVRRYV